MVGLLGVVALFGFATLPVTSAMTALPDDARLDLLDLQVFAKQSIQASRSDYEGPTAARGRIDLQDFEIFGDLISATGIAYHRGQVKGRVRSPDLRLADVFSSGPGSIPDQALELAAMKLDLIAARLASLPATSRIAIGPGADGTTDLTAEAHRTLEVVDLAGDRLIAAGDGRTRLVLKGGEGTRLLVRVHGSSVRLHRLGFSVEGGLDPSRIVFFFPEAADLEIFQSGGALDGSGRSWNVPGSIVAPSAALRFGASTVHGQVFVRAIASIPGSPGGQVDRLARMGSEGSGGPGDRITPSQLLEMVGGDGFAQALPPYREVADEASQGLPSGCRLVCARADSSPWPGLRQVQ